MHLSGGKSNRREFLKKGLATTALGLGYFRVGLREALAEAATTGKPILSQESLNALIPKNPAQFRAAAQEARKDLKGFLRNHFTLTPAQEKGLTTMGQVEVDKVVRAIDSAVQKNYRLQAQIITPGNPNTGKVAIKSGVAVQKVPDKSCCAVQKVREAAAAKEPGVHVGPFTVTADASYSHSDGFSGTVSFSVDCG